MIDSDAAEFLERMRQIADHKRWWLEEEPDSRRTQVYVRRIETFLRVAGRVIGLHPRFEVLGHIYEDGTRNLEIIPMNGAAEQMMARYEQLLLEYELSQG